MRASDDDFRELTMRISESQDEAYYMFIVFV